MRGHIRKRGKNSWTIILSQGRDPVTRKYRQDWITVRGTKKDASQRLTEVLHQMDTGSFVKPTKVTVSEFLETSFLEYARLNLAPRTVEGYETIIRSHIEPILGNIPLHLFKPDHIQKYCLKMLSAGRCNGEGGLSPTTVRQHYMVLRRALHLAMTRGLISRNPADAVEPPRCQRREMRVMNEQEAHAILELARFTLYYMLFYLALFTGMRRGELMALRWCDIDLILSQLSVNRSLHHLRDGSFVIRSPKTAKGRRTISLSPATTLALKGYKEEQASNRLLRGTLLKENDLVFAHPDGSPLLPDSVTQAWRRLARRAGLKGIRLHDARHTHATLMMKQGIHPKIVQERLGHASIQITLDTYSHVVPGLQEAAAARFDEVMFPKSREEAKTPPA